MYSYYNNFVTIYDFSYKTRVSSENNSSTPVVCSTYCSNYLFTLLCMTFMEKGSIKECVHKRFIFLVLNFETKSGIRNIGDFLHIFGGFIFGARGTQQSYCIKCAKCSTSKYMYVRAAVLPFPTFGALFEKLTE